MTLPPCNSHEFVDPSFEEPIVAVASPPGVGAIAIIRLSGRNLQVLAEPFLKWNKPLSSLQARKMVMVDILHPSDGSTLDEVLVCYFKGPYSYTGEDVFEIYPHGSPYIVEELLKICLGCGFRQAHPGEFTRRAFLNGKLDLTTADGIRGLTEAVSKQQWQAARYLFGGQLGDWVRSLRERLLRALAFLEASIDFPEEGDTQDVTIETVTKLVSEVSSSIREVKSRYHGGKVMTEGFKVALLGLPNAGKSSLMNRMLSEDRAIVTDIPGTTRDYLEESCLLQGRLVRLIDTAGLRQTDDKVEKIGIERSLQIAKKADLVIFLSSCEQSQKERTEVDGWKSLMGSTPFLEVVTKIDLACELDLEGKLGISTLVGTGIDDFEQTLVDRIDKFVDVAQGEGLYITNARHKLALDQAEEGIQRFFESKDAGQFDECLAFELQYTTGALETIVGRVEQDDVLDVLFSEFCVGK